MTAQMPSPAVDRFLAKLFGVRRNGNGWMARCPGHDDTHPSLSVHQGDDGRVLLNCHAGCPVEEIVGALGLTVGDLFVQHDEPRERHAAHSRSPRKIVATYDYTDEHGELLFQVVRFDPKDFRQRRPNGKGGWSWNLDGVRLVPYRLPELLAAVSVGKHILIVEGERDVETLRALGLVATTNPMGAGKWRSEFAPYFSGAHVAVPPDADDVGRQHAHDVARSLAGVAAEVKVVTLPGLPDKGDVTDWFALGHTVEDLRALADATPAWREDPPTTVQTAPSVPNGIEVRKAGALRHESDAPLAFLSASEFLNESDPDMSWVVFDWMASEGTSAFVAKPKVGKSTLARDLAICVARGEQFLGRLTKQGTVFYLALEDRKSHVKRHFKQMGMCPEDPIRIFCDTTPDNGLARLRKATELVRPSLIIIDPLFRFTRVKDVNDYAIITEALASLLALSRDLQTHIVFTHHASKGIKGEALTFDNILGSTAIGGSVDTTFLLRRDTSGVRTIETQGRYGEGDLPEYVLTYDPITGRSSIGSLKSEAIEVGIADAILHFLSTKWAPTRDEVLAAIAGKASTKLDVLHALVDAKKVLCIGGGRRGSPYRYTLPPNGGGKGADEGSSEANDPIHPGTGNGILNPSKSTSPAGNRERNKPNTNGGILRSQGSVVGTSFPSPKFRSQGKRARTESLPLFSASSNETGNGISTLQSREYTVPSTSSEIPLLHSVPVPMPCSCCGSVRFWKSAYGMIRCATCHPPAVPDLVAEWMGPDPADGLPSDPGLGTPAGAGEVV